MHRFSIQTKLLLAALILCSTLRGESQATQKLTRLQAVELALSSNKSLVAARSLIDRARARREGVGRLDNPELSVEYATDWMFNDEGQSSVGIGFSQRFPVTKRLSILKDLVETEIAMAEAEVANQERMVAREVELLCNELAYLESQLALRQSLLEVDKRFGVFVESRIQVGEASPVDLNQIRIELYAIEQEIGELGIEREMTLSRLRPLLGLEVDQELGVAQRMLVPVAAPELPVFDSEQLDTHPEYRLQKLLLQVAEKQGSLAKTSRWDDISVGVSLEQERSIDEPLGIGTERFLGVAVSIPLPLRDRSQSLVRESLSLKSQREAELAARSLELRSRESALRKQVNGLYAQATYYETSITSLVEQNLEEMSEAYSAGQISLNELFRSQSQRLKIQSAHLEMVRDYEQAIAEWKAATTRNL